MSENLQDAIEAIDKEMRQDDECDKRAIIVTETQYHSLGALTDEIYTEKSGAVHKLFSDHLMLQKQQNGVLE